MKVTIQNYNEENKKTDLLEQLTKAESREKYLLESLAKANDEREY